MCLVIYVAQTEKVLTRLPTLSTTRWFSFVSKFCWYRMMPLVLLPLEWLLLLLLTDALQLHTSRRQATWNVFSLIFVIFNYLREVHLEKNPNCGIGKCGSVCDFTHTTKPYLLLSFSLAFITLLCTLHSTMIL